MRRLARRWRRWRERKLIAANGAFDRDFYLARNPDLATAGVDPLDHYVACGADEGRLPNPIFDSRWYLDTYFPHAAEPPNPLADYLRHVKRRPRRPCRWFDLDHYRRAMGLGPRQDAMRHYLAAGRDAADAGPELDWASLRRHCPDAATTPLGLYLNDWRLRARIDSCTSCYVSGWASRNVGPPIVVTVLVNGQARGTVTPWIARDDITSVLDIDARGFYVVFPSRLEDSDTVVLQDERGEIIVGCKTTYTIPPLGSTDALYGNRAAIAATFLHGRGVEIGAFTQPTDLPPDRQVLYFDRFRAERLREVYDERWCRPLFEPDVVGDAATLTGLPDGGFDFLIANHVLEHLEDPIAFLQVIAVKLAAGGRAMIAVPDMRYGADATRTPTSFEHLVADHEHGPERSRFGHYLESAGINGLAGTAAHAFATAMPADTTLVHYHVWDADGFYAFVDAAIGYYALPLSRLYATASVHEIIVVLEKTRGDAAAG